MEWVKKGHQNSHIFARPKSEMALHDLWRGLQEKDFSIKSELILEDLIFLGSVYVNRSRIADTEIVLQPEDLVEIYSAPKRYVTPDLRSRILHDEKEFLVVNKPANLPSHPTVDNLRENLLFGLEEIYQQKLFLPHRLDQETSGLMLIAKNEIALKKINDLFSQRQIVKKYLALVHGSPTARGLVTHYMKPGLRAPKTLSLSPLPEWKECVLGIEQVYAVGNFSLLGIQLYTGRTHQIRAQLAFKGHAIKGDRLYGNPETEPIDLQLTSVELAFPWQIEGQTNIQKRTFSL